jgi:mRNA (guanine-N7-)-methyltransferase
MVDLGFPDNARPNVDVNQRRESPIIGLKSFNNWIKSVIIAKWAAPIFIGDGMDAGARRNNRPKGRVLDMGCGKGGDLQKWQKSRIQYYCGLDVAETSISQARDRASQLRSVSGFNVDFHTLDCYAQSVETVLNDDELRQNPFDIVSMQFCMHYAFENISKVKLMLANVTRYLRVGGRFIGTVPNANFLQ